MQQPGAASTTQVSRRKSVAKIEVAGEALLPFRARRQAALDGAGQLDGLQPDAAGLADAQGDAAAAQDQSRRVEILVEQPCRAVAERLGQ
jgi:hypothetical protein